VRDKLALGTLAIMVACSRSALDVGEPPPPSDAGHKTDASAPADAREEPPIITLDATTPLLRGGQITASRWVYGGVTGFGVGHTCVVTAARGVQCWGANFNGQLGNGSHKTSWMPVDVQNLANVVQITAGGGHTCALEQDGSVWCWGSGGAGEIGDGLGTSESTPARVTGITNAVLVRAGTSSTCALLSTGRVSCWGLELGGETSLNTPVDAGVSQATSLDVVDWHACVSTTGGDVQCWGTNEGAVLAADPDTLSGSLTPMKVAGGLGEITQVVTSGGTACALVGQKTLSCWGWNSDGEIGNGTISDALVLTPALAIASDVATFDGGWLHACVVTTAGAVECWGGNGLGQLGDGTNDDRGSPVTPIASGALAVAAGAAHTCALMEDGRVLCWGMNLSGALGVNAALTPSSNVPVEVYGL
jgi:alpha-tubulin suppressor-like RCC1 family protein